MPEPGDNQWPLVDDDDLPADIPPAPPEVDQPVAGTLEVEPQPPPRPVQPTVAIEQPTQRLEWPPREPPRAAPARIGPESPPPPPPPPVSPRRRGRTVALITVAALIVVAGAGAVAVFTVPGLKAKLGLGGAAPTVVLEPPPPPIQFAPALRPPGTDAAAPSAAGLSAALTGPLSAPGLGTLTGTVLDPATGTALWDQGAGTPLVPASTGKLLTAAAALLSVSHTAQFSTKVVAGKDPGSVVIVGGGDPTLSSLKVGADSVYPGAAHLSELVDQVTAHGTAQTVYVDVSRYAGNAMEASWIPGDVPGGYIAPIMSVMLDGGRADATKETSPRSPTPAKAVAEAFANRIGAKVAPEVTTTAPQGAAVLGEVRSAPMVELVDTLLQRSDNVLAEAVGHEVARAAGEEPSFAGASRATAKVLRDNGFDVTGLSMADASGLSGQDKVPARLLASILAVAAGPDGKDPRTAKLRPLLGGLPVAGGSGTLAERYNTGGAAVGRGWVRAKTGTLSVPQVNSLAGIVLDNDGRLLVFALMTNGSAAGTARPALDTIAATLRKCGCK